MPAHGTGATSEPQHQIRLLTRFARETAESLEASWQIYQRCPGDPPPWEDQAAALAALDQLLARARDIRGQIEAEAAPHVPRTATAVPDVGLVTRHGRSERKRWDVDALRATVAQRLGARLADDPAVMVDEDGCTLPPAEIVLRATGRTVEAMADLCGMTPSKDWRKTALEGLGIDVLEYRSSEFGGWRVAIEEGVIDTTEGAAQ